MQSNPHHPNKFISALENGTLQIWVFRGSASVLLFARIYEIAQYQNTRLWELIKVAILFLLLVFSFWLGFVLTVSWHPEKHNVFATGGRDGKIKVTSPVLMRSSSSFSVQVWDTMKTESRTPDTVIQTLAVGVGRVQWRPGYSSQVIDFESFSSFLLPLACKCCVSHRFRYPHLGL